MLLDLKKIEGLKLICLTPLQDTLLPLPQRQVGWPSSNCDFKDTRGYSYVPASISVFLIHTR